MQCALCGHSTLVYTGALNPWQECASCGAAYCDRCSRGDSNAAPEQTYLVSRNRVCPTCNGQLVRK